MEPKGVTPLEKVMELWAVDSIVEETEIGRELLKIPTLHSKYLRILSAHNLLAKKYTSDYQKLKTIKWEYYKGDLNNPDDLKKYNLEPNLKRINRPDISMYLDSDNSLNDLLLKKAMHEEVASYCNSIIKELNNRTWELKSYIDWEKFIKDH